MDLAFKRFRVHRHFAYDSAQEIFQFVTVKAGHVVSQIVQNAAAFAKMLEFSRVEIADGL